MKPSSKCSETKEKQSYKVSDDKLLKLYEILNDKSYYSLGINYTSKLSGLPISYLRSLSRDYNNSQRFEDLTNDSINIFTFNKVEYIGLESRRIAYEEDKVAGTNWVEDAIKRGDYD